MEPGPLSFPEPVGRYLSEADKPWLWDKPGPRPAEQFLI